MLYTLNSDVYQLYLNKAEKKIIFSFSLIEGPKGFNQKNNTIFFFFKQIKRFCPNSLIYFCVINHSFFFF